MTVDGVRHRYLLLVALRWLPIGFVAPLLVLVLLERGLSLAQVGGVMAVYGITTAVLELPTGGLADTLGRRPVLLLSAVLGTAFMALVLVLHGVIGMAVAAFVGGVSRALDSGPLEAWFVDTTRQLDSDADLERGLSRGNMLDGVALAVGAVAGGVLPQLFAGRLDVSLVAALACHAAHVAAIATLMTETGPSRQERWRHAFARIPRVMRDGATLTVRHTHVRRLMLGFVAIGVCLSGVEVLWQPRFAALLGAGASATGVFGIVLATGFAAAGLGALMAPWLRRRFNGRIAPAVVLAQGMMGLSVLLLAAAGQFVFAAVALVASYFFNGLMSPYLAELLHEHVPAERRTTMVSVRSLSLQSGGFVGALTLPGLAAMHGIPTAWMLAGSIVGLAALLYAGIPNRATAPAPHIQAVSTPVT